MAKIDDLVAQIADPKLRAELEKSVKELKKNTRFGLVFEDHIPEMSALVGLPLTVGELAMRRDAPSGRAARTVKAIHSDGTVTLEDKEGNTTTEPASDWLAAKQFGQPIYPGLEKVGEVKRGGADRPHHAVINAENYHAAQLLLYLYEGQVDCIYLDPPYNTGAKDWTYNNDYVDSSDAWRHSKWLSFMEKRLKLAKKLLKHDGVLIVTIDEHEVHHLGMLLEELFPECLRHLISIVINPKGTAATNFARVDEYAFFVCPSGNEIIEKMPFDFGLPLPPKK
ncbi:MAG: DNA methyltransferase, partial [Armatimonadetes bacterium]|nr:DNA methyltransferase [Armatimonadota bacterium]